MKKTLFLLVLLPYLSFGQNIAVTATNIFNGEPTLAVNPLNPQTMVAAWIGIDFSEGTVIRSSYSLDGGLTWSASIFMPHIVAGNSSADPSLQYNSSGEVFLCYIDHDATNFSNGQIVVRKSTDNGASWGAAVEAISLLDCPGKLCVDRPWMEIDRSGGANDGAIYVTSMNANQPTLVTPPYNPYLSVSSDNGASFVAPRFLDTLGYLAGSSIPQPMPSPAIGADGRFYASYPSYETSQDPFAHIYLASSTSLGADFDQVNLYTILIPGVSDPLAKKAGKLLADPSTPNHLIQLSLSEVNGDVDILFQETFNGLTWTSPTRVNQDPIANGKMQDLVWGEFNANGDLAICWRDRRNASASGYQTETEIYGVIRFKDSSNFESDFPISSQQVNHGAILNESGNDFLSVRYVGNMLYTIWGDVRTGTLNIFLNRYNVTTGTSSLSEVHSESGVLQVYPNPAQDLVHLTHFNDVEDLQLVDAHGKFIQSVQADQFSVLALPAGTYHLFYFFKGKGFVQTFVKE